MMSGTESHVFTPNKPSTARQLLRAVIHLILGSIAWLLLAMFLLSLLERVIGPIDENLLVVVIILLFIFGGIIFVPLLVFLRWYTAASLTIALDSATGMTVIRKSGRRGEQISRYGWQDVTGTEMVGTTEGEGLHTSYTFYVHTADGQQLKIPQSMESFDYFYDFVNRAAAHLPYTWSIVDYLTAKSQGIEQGLFCVPRKQI